MSASEDRPPPRFGARRALVTGASRGIGAAVAQRLAAEGADVALVARTLDRHDHLAGSLRETEQTVARHGTRVGVVVADVTDEHDRARIIPEAEAALGGPIDILVNNAAAAIYDRVATFPLRRRRVLFEANVHAPLDLAQAVIPAMRDAGEGWIVNITSRAADLAAGPPFAPEAQDSTTAVYGASKAALRRVTNGLGVELSGTGIRVNAVEPRAAVLTEGAAALVGERLRPDQVESLEGMVEAVVALCDCPPEVTGEVLVSLDLLADLGLTVRRVDGSPLR